MRILSIIDEDFNNYKLPSMFIGTIQCGGKCCIESNIPLSICHNDKWRNKTPINISDEEIINRYLSNNLTSAIVFGGLEPFEQWDELKLFIDLFRSKCNHDLVIYTGYNKDEILDYVNELKSYDNIIIKFGRYIPNIPNRYDEVLGVTLVSDNQYAERI